MNCFPRFFALSLFSVGLTVGFGAQASGQVVPSGWKQVFSDGFNGNLNTGKWTVATHRDTFPGGFRSNQRYEAFRVKSGVSRGSAKVLELTSGQAKDFPGGGKITSKSKLISNVGILRARIRLSSDKKKKYIWPTFWAIDGSKGELDIYEGKGLETGINYAAHANGKIRDFGFYNKSFSVTQWRNYGVWVRRGSTRPEFYVNTKLARRTPKGSWNPRANAPLIFSSSPNLVKKLKKNGLPSMWIDWVTVHRP